jgi:hypothetical protein
MVDQLWRYVQWTPEAECHLNMRPKSQLQATPKKFLRKIFAVATRLLDSLRLLLDIQSSNIFSGNIVLRILSCGRTAKTIAQLELAVFVS